MGQTIPIAQGFYESESLPISAQECRNWYVNIPQTATITQANLFGTPGINQLAIENLIDECRGSGLLDEIPFFVIGNDLVRLSRTFVDGNEVFTIDNISTSTGINIEGFGRVSISANETQLCIVAPDFNDIENAYIFTDDPDTLVQIDDPAFDGPVSFVVFVDGLFLFTKQDGKKFFQSPISDGRGSGNGGAPYDALAFGTAEVDPDPIQSAIVHRNQVFIFGTKTIEVFQNVGTVPFAFSRINGFVMPKGISAPFSAIEFQNNFVFIGAGLNEKPAIWRFTGNNLQKISTTAIEQLLGQASDLSISSSFAWVYSENGAYFVGFTSASRTFVYDDVTALWHERSSFDDGEGRYRVSTMVPAYGRIIVGDLTDGRIGELDKKIFTEYGNVINRVVSTPPFDNNGEPFFVSKIEAVMETGLNETGVEASMMMSTSRDGSHTYKDSSPKSLGSRGNFIQRPQWKQLGRFYRSGAFRFEFSGNIKPVFLKLEADFE